MIELPETPHRRLNVLTGEWVLVSPHRSMRPWQGQREIAVGDSQPTHDPQCYLCPGNARVGGERNPLYSHTFVFQNDFSALLPSHVEYPNVGTGLIQAKTVQGECRVICFSPRHDLTMAQMQNSEISKVIEVWADLTTELGRKYPWVQLFENKGAAMGCSNPHPHGQVWAGSAIPTYAKSEDVQQLQHFRTHESNLLMDYVTQEIGLGERIIERNESWIVLVPFWAVWPFEYLVVPIRHVLRMPDLTAIERERLADILRRCLIRYDNLFDTRFPYSMGWHGAPTDDGNYDHWQLHAHFYPPLLRSAEVRKFMVGYEMLAEPQRDITPEQAAEMLRTVSGVHYKAV